VSRDGIPFVSLAWAGMAGCVSAMNREGLSILVNGLRPSCRGTWPPHVIVRGRRATRRTIAEAVEIVRGHGFSSRHASWW